MLIFKKIVAAIFMFLSVVAVILLTISLFGSWVVKGQLETATIGLLLAGENIIDVTRGRLEQADGILEKSSTAADNVNQKINQLSDKVAENTSAVAVIMEAINSDLVPAATDAVDAFNAVVANLVAINDAVDAINDIPLLRLNNNLPSMTRLQELEDQIARLRDRVMQLRETAEKGRAELIDGKIATLVDFASGLITDIDSTRVRLAETDATLEQSAADLAALRQSIPRLFLLITLLLNLLFILAIIAFISLFLHAWQYFKCVEDGLSALMPHECEKVQAVT